MSSTDSALLRLENVYSANFSLLVLLRPRHLHQVHPELPYPPWRFQNHICRHFLQYERASRFLEAGPIPSVGNIELIFALLLSYISLRVKGGSCHSLFDCAQEDNTPLSRCLRICNTQHFLVVDTMDGAAIVSAQPNTMNNLVFVCCN